MGTIKDRISEITEEWKSKIEELELQVNLGKTEALDELESWKKKIE